MDACPLQLARTTAFLKSSSMTLLRLLPTLCTVFMSGSVGKFMSGNDSCKQMAKVSHKLSMKSSTASQLGLVLKPKLIMRATVSMRVGPAERSKFCK